MISKLCIRNYLILKEAEIDFSPGLNILTGETGAGKTIIIDALMLILGERADYSIINAHQEKLIVEGQFDLSKSKEAADFLGKLFPDEDINPSDVIIRRELLRKGSSRSFINDNAVNISDMKRLGDLIVDIHSQNEHQSLLNPETHITILDAFSGNHELMKKYSDEFESLRNLISEYRLLSEKKDDLLERKRFIEHELKEINNLNPREGEDEELENELRMLENIENIKISLDRSIGELYENEINSIATVGAAIKELKKILQYDSSLGKIAEDLESSYVILKECSDSLLGRRENISFDDDHIEVIRKRLSDITHLKKKYSMSLGDLIAKAEKLRSDLGLSENFDYELEKRSAEIEKRKTSAAKLAGEIHKFRVEKAKELEKKIKQVLREVGLEGADFKADVRIRNANSEDGLNFRSGKIETSLGPAGIDEAEFLIMTNKGMDFSPLHKTASGGEISRVMLAIKSVLASKDKIGILVFDEIDAGISGTAAAKVAASLKKLSRTHQIICITHLPQIAACGERNFHVSKSDSEKETVAAISRLTPDGKVKEIAKLISGEKITSAAEKSAEELVRSSEGK